MFSLKLWIGPLLLLIVGGLMLTLGSSLLYELLVPPHEAILDANRVAANGFLQTDSERSLTAAALPTADPAVRAFVLNPPSEGEAPPALKEALLSVDSSRLGRPDFAVLLNKEGKVILTAGTATGVPPDASALPWARDALTGQLGDALHRGPDGAPFHLASAPLVDNGVPAGVVAMAWALDVDFVNRAEKALTTGAVLFDNDKVIHGRTGVDDATLAAVRKSGSAGLAETEIPVPGLPFLVPNANRYLGKSVSLYRGDKSLELLLVEDRNSTIRALVWAQAGTVGITLLLFLLLVVLVLSVLKSIRRPMDVITEHLSQYAQGTQTGIIPEASLSGPFVRLAKQINMILQAPAPGSAPRPGTAPITNPSGIPAMQSPNSNPSLPNPASAPSSSSIPIPPTPPPQAEVTFDGIPGLGADDPPPPQTPPPATPPPTPPHTNPDEQIAPVAQAPVSDELASSALAGLFDDGGGADPLAAFRVEAQPTPPPAPAPTPPPAASSGSADDYNPEATVMFQVPEELIQESAQASQASQPPVQAAPPTPPPAAPVEDRTVVAQVPQELLSKAAPKVNVAEQEQAHYKEVFQDFLRTRQECGEDTSDLTYDRFVAKLMKNRQAIMEKYKCKSVRFQVYVKGSKAALRALPVRE